MNDYSNILLNTFIVVYIFNRFANIFNQFVNIFNLREHLQPVREDLQWAHAEHLHYAMFSRVRRKPSHLNMALRPGPTAKYNMGLGSVINVTSSWRLRLTMINF